MSKTLKIYIGVLVVIIIVAMSIESSKPVTIDWTETYNERHTKPYGLKILHKEFSNLFDKASVKNIRNTPYEYFNAKYDWDTYKYTVEGSYISINPYYYTDESSLNELLDFASEGNTIFMSTHEIPRYIQDSLGFRTKYDYKLSTEAELGFSNYNLKHNVISFEKGIKNIYFSEIDTLTTIPLGYQKFSNDSIYTNFIKIPVGDGTFLLHTQPVVFTNFHLLKDEHYKYAEGVLGYIPNKDIYFDSQNKYGVDESNSPLRFILSEPALRWAWFLSLLTLLVFILFNVKRKQRIVKIINPLENTTVDFAKTIGNLFYETKDHENVVRKKITYFLEHLRNEYLMNTQALDERFVKRLALKSGKKQEDIFELISLIIKLKKKVHFQEQDVLNITKAIERFHKKE
ncbi:DUF4350 domain-containing protein [uncultured Kordia sp.]|uniref:DUF4350 domain-containing protein n=1 Tax=uncultured Kordia sp. TaxID=507699 RepID=UPI002625B539|nr:DUF4350 domain-containing protein [uncultured Kordia sp.]